LIKTIAAVMATMLLSGCTTTDYGEPIDHGTVKTYTFVSQPQSCSFVLVPSNANKPTSLTRVFANDDGRDCNKGRPDAYNLYDTDRLQVHFTAELVVTSLTSLSAGGCRVDYSITNDTKGHHSQQFDEACTNLGKNVGDTSTTLLTGNFPPK